MEKNDNNPEKNNDDGSHEKYKYEDSGIQEKQGKIPLWLSLTAIGLLIWSVYYTITYWEA